MASQNIPHTWSALARYAATQQNTLHVYACESAMRSICALSHALALSGLHPTSEILFFYHTPLHKPNFNHLQNTPITFISNQSDTANYLSANTFEPIHAKINSGKNEKLWLYLPAHALKIRCDDNDTFDNNFYYIAQAERVFLYEEGDASYVEYTPARQDNKRLQQEVLSRLYAFAQYIRTHCPLHEKDGFTRYKNARELATLRAFCQQYQLIDLHYYLSHWEQIITFWQYPHLLYSKPHIADTPLPQHALLDISDTLALLTPEPYQQLLSYFDFYPQQFLKNYLRDANRKNLLIIGTHSMTEAFPLRVHGLLQMVAWMQVLVKEYGETHNILFKPHPRHVSRVARSCIANGLMRHLRFLPSQLPVELLSLTDIVDVYMATISSSLYFKPVREKLKHIILLPPLPSPDGQELISARIAMLLQIGYTKAQFKVLEKDANGANQLVNFWR